MLIANGILLCSNRAVRRHYIGRTSTIRSERRTMYFTLKAAFPKASYDFAQEITRTNPAARITNSGILIVQLLANPTLSRETFPDEWAADESVDTRPGSFAPNFSKGYVRRIYELPQELAGQDFELALEGRELDIKDSHSQVITGYNGEPLRPYRTQSSHKVRHFTSLVFTKSTMGVIRLRLDGGLRIQRAYTEPFNGGVIMRVEELLKEDEFPALSDRSRAIISSNPTWTKAIAAVISRSRCESDGCIGHYRNP